MVSRGWAIPCGCTPPLLRSLSSCLPLLNLLRPAAHSHASAKTDDEDLLPPKKSVNDGHVPLFIGEAAKEYAARILEGMQPPAENRDLQQAREGNLPPAQRGDKRTDNKDLHISKQGKKTGRLLSTESQEEDGQGEKGDATPCEPHQEELSQDAKGKIESSEPHFHEEGHIEKQNGFLLPVLHADENVANIEPHPMCEGKDLLPKTAQIATSAYVYLLHASEASYQVPLLQDGRAPLDFYDARIIFPNLKSIDHKVNFFADLLFAWKVYFTTPRVKMKSEIFLQRLQKHFLNPDNTNHPPILQQFNPKLRVKMKTYLSNTRLLKCFIDPGGHDYLLYHFSHLRGSNSGNHQVREMQAETYGDQSFNLMQKTKQKTMMQIRMSYLTKDVLDPG